jgi:5-dehydro-2-deoxygluconokinase
MKCDLFAKERAIDVICMGRVAVDLYAEQINSPLEDVQSFRKYLGGCAGNIAVGTSRLGLKSMMFSAIGADAMGQFVKNTLNEEGVLSNLLYQVDDYLTGLVLLGVSPPDTFPLIFYREQCADMQLKTQHCNEVIFNQSKSLLITGTGLSTDSMRQTTHHAISLCHKTNTKVIIDLDYRPVLWNVTTKGDGQTRYVSNESVSKCYLDVLPLCDLIVGTEEEILIASGEQKIEKAIAKIQAISRAPIVIKQGEKGCRIMLNDSVIKGKTFNVEVLNVLGAGDAFLSGLLSILLKGGDWQKAADVANACGALVVTRHGCAPAIPSKKEVIYFMSTQHTSKFSHETLERFHRKTAMKITAAKTITLQNNAMAMSNGQSFIPLYQDDVLFESIDPYAALVNRCSNSGVFLTLTAVNQSQLKQFEKLVSACVKLDRTLMIYLKTKTVMTIAMQINLFADFFVVNNEYRGEAKALINDNSLDTPLYVFDEVTQQGKLFDEDLIYVTE